MSMKDTFYECLIEVGRILAKAENALIFHEE
jgi:hypothetical protein